MNISQINVGSTQEISIRSLAYKIKDLIGFDGRLTFDKSKPDGTPRKKLDLSRLKNLGWNQKISLDKGILTTLKWYKNQLR